MVLYVHYFLAWQMLLTSTQKCRDVNCKLQKCKCVFLSFIMQQAGVEAGADSSKGNEKPLLLFGRYVCTILYQAII